jgi:cytochrome b6-f complex iron-sulfur subunit
MADSPDQSPLRETTPDSRGRSRRLPSASGHRHGRRGFLAAVGRMLFGSALAVGLTSLAATCGLWLLGLARFMLPNVVVEPPSRFKAGRPDDYEPGQVETRFIARFRTWIVRDRQRGGEQIYALRAMCTHLGCTPIWLDGEQVFKCPCHGSGFYKDGTNFEGPAPRPLERFAIRVADDGRLEVDKSRVFRQELGQWNDPDSFVSVQTVSPDRQTS